MNCFTQRYTFQTKQGQVDLKEILGLGNMQVNKSKEQDRSNVKMQAKLFQFKVGDKVELYQFVLGDSGGRNSWVGPYTIVDVSSNFVALMHDLSAEIIHNISVRRIKLVDSRPSELLNNKIFRSMTSVSISVNLCSIKDIPTEVTASNISFLRKISPKNALVPMLY